MREVSTRVEVLHFLLEYFSCARESTDSKAQVSRISRSLREREREREKTATQNDKKSYRT